MDPSYFLHPSRFVFVLHTVWWGGFLLARAKLLGHPRPVAKEAPRHESETVHAPHAAGLVRAHSAAIIGLYPAVWTATTLSELPGLVRGSFAVLFLTLGGVVAAWTLTVFRSYRLRATLEAGHELCESGPFRLVRHPLYLAFGLLGVGSALWAPSPATWLVTALLWVIGDLRARGEERLLEETFGERYQRYRSGTYRLVPWLY